MNLETLFNEEDIKEIYDDTVIYSILKYEGLPGVWKQEFKSRYLNALKYVKQRGIEDKLSSNKDILMIKGRLETYKQLYHTILEQNKIVIDEVAPFIEKIIIDNVLSKELEIERVSLFVNFIISYITYSEDYFCYCLSVPPVDGLEFDFKGNLPVDSSINGMLVIGQGLCDNIANLLVYFGNKLNLKIDKVFVQCNGYEHAINCVTLEDGNNYLVDATRIIRGEKSKEEALMVSFDKLNCYGEYGVDREFATKTYQGMLPNYQGEVNMLIRKIKQIKPQVIDLNEVSSRKRR